MDDTQLAALFGGWGDKAAAQAQDDILTGIAAGLAPSAVAKTLRDTLDGLTVQRAQVIAHDQMMREYRDTTLDTYRENADVLDGWMWWANLGTACAECTAMHGTVHSLDEGMDSHVGCHCTEVPITRSSASILRDAGLSDDEIAAADLPDEPEYGPTGVQWFKQQSAAEQQRILGPGAYALYAQDDITLRDLVQWVNDPVWGRQLRRRTLAQLARRKAG